MAEMAESPRNDEGFTDPKGVTPNSESTFTSGSSPRCDDIGKHIHICVLVHGMGGCCKDWDVWIEVLAARLPHWKLVVLEGLAKGARFMASGVDALAELAADEMLRAIDAESRRFEMPIILHCIGHSMGGLILRGALPLLLDKLGDDSPKLGHYLSLSTPHLGIQASWAAPLHAWRNLCVLLPSWMSPQLAQLSVQDDSKLGQTAYLMDLSDPDGQHVAAMRKFSCRTCATVARGDPLVSVASGLIDPVSCHSYQKHGAMPTPYGSSCHDEEDPDDCRWQELADESSPDAAECQPSMLRRLQLFLLAWLLKACALLPMVSKATERQSARAHWSLHQCSSPSGWNREEEQKQQHKSARSPSALSWWSSTSSVKTWRVSADGTCRFPDEILQGLDSMPWRRFVAEVYNGPIFGNSHVFLIAKSSQQSAKEHLMSRECIECLAETLGNV